MGIDYDDGEKKDLEKTCIVQGLKLYEQQKRNDTNAANTNANTDAATKYATSSCVKMKAATTTAVPNNNNNNASCTKLPVKAAKKRMATASKSTTTTTSGKRGPRFPVRLYDMLENAERDGYGKQKHTSALLPPSNIVFGLVIIFDHPRHE